MLWPFRDYLCQRSAVHSVQCRVVHDQKGDTYEVKVHICAVPLPPYTIEQCCVYECRRKVSDVWHATPRLYTLVCDQFLLLVLDRVLLASFRPLDSFVNEVFG